MKSKEDYLFLPAPLFMIRTPLLPIEQFFQMVHQDNLNDHLLKLYSTNSSIRQAILIASPSLDEALKAIHSKTAKDKDQIFSSLLKYVLRMATRPTPFGLFAFISAGSWGERAAVHFEHGAIRQRARPDMEWLFSVIDRICHTPAFFPALPIRSNPLVTYSVGRYYLDHVRKTEDDKGKKKLSIRATPLTSTLLEIAKSPITIEEAERQLLERHPMLQREKISEVISTLVEQQFLISHLHPTLLTTTPFEDLLKKLASLPLESSPFALLGEIAEEIKEYNNNENVDDRYQRFHAIQEKMEGLATSAHYLQVDAAYEKGGKAETLPQEIGYELARAVEVLCKLSYKKREQGGLDAYRRKFLERYSGRQIPLLELLGEQGLGPPEHYQDPNKREIGDSSKQSKFNQWLTQEYCSCLQERRREIVLTEALVAQHVDSDLKDEDAALSFDLFFEVIADSQASIEQGDYLLYISQSTWQGGSIFGRFIDLMDGESTKALQKLAKEEEQLEPEVLFVETSYLSSSSRAANVSMNPNLRSYQLDINGVSKDQISLEDILVGVSSAGKFYLMHKEKGKELVFTSHNVLNYLFAPIPIRFIKDVSLERHHFMSPLDWDSLEQFPYQPRVRFDKTILSPAKWNVNLSVLNATNKESTESIAEKFHEWAQRWDLPRYLFLTSGDNRILLDRHHPQHRQEISIRLKQDPMIRLVEKIGEEKGEWVTSGLGSHLTEFVAPFIKNKKYSLNPQIISPLPYQPVPSTTRWKLFGSEWLYVKFYLSQENEMRFIVQHLSVLTHYLLTENIVQDWFFVRYADPTPHIRVRFRANSEKIISKLTPLLHQWCHSLLHDHLFRDIQISIYDREIERYGGEQLIEDAEAFFCADSATAINLLQLLADKKIPIPDYVVAALSLIDLLNGFGMSLADMCKFLKNTPKDELKGFREWRSPLSTLVGAYFNFDHAAPNEEAVLLHQAFQKRKTAQQQLTIKMADLQNQGLLSSLPATIQDSILHMHCNRLMGISGALEKKARAFALHTLESFHFPKKPSAKFD
jgi:thiopeptide-type bacteriocin biosynthesis protein